MKVKDTRTRFQGVYARHRLRCAIVSGSECDCTPAYWGKVYDRASGCERKTVMCSTPTAARTARSQLSTRLATGGVGGRLCVSEAIDAFLTAAEAGTALSKRGRPYKPSALRGLRGSLERYVKPRLGRKRLDDMRRGDVQRLVDELTPRLSGSAVRNIVNALRSLYGWARLRELATHDPVTGVRLPAVDATFRYRIATVGELRRLLGALDPVDALPYALAAYTGARRNEIRHLRSQDIDITARVVRLGADDGARKSDAALRVVPIAEPLRDWLTVPTSEHPGALVVPGPGSNAYSGPGLLSFEALQERADARWAAAGLDRITAHGCRHTFVSWLDAAGVRPTVISRLAGHSLGGEGAGVTARYTHMLPDDLERARELFDGYLDKN